MNAGLLGVEVEHQVKIPVSVSIFDMASSMGFPLSEWEESPTYTKNQYRGSTGKGRNRKRSSPQRAFAVNEELRPGEETALREENGRSWGY